MLFREQLQQVLKTPKRKLTIMVSWGFNNNCFVVFFCFVFSCVCVVVFLQYTHTISLTKWDKIPLNTLLIVNNFKNNFKNVRDQ